MQGFNIYIEPNAVLFAKCIIDRLTFNIEAEFDRMVFAGKIIEVSLERNIREAVLFQQFDIF